MVGGDGGGTEEEAFDALPIFFLNLSRSGGRRNWNCMGGSDQRIPREENPCWARAETLSSPAEGGMTTEG